MPEHAMLFGAGASYGSDDAETPPLGDALFDSLRRFNPDGWGSLPSDIGDAFLGDFEAGMRNLSEVSSHGLPPLQRAMAAYFFNFTPRTSNSYVALARKIRTRGWDGALVTLNYERLLEIALAHAGVRPVVNMEPESATDVELCLPHGCCHLFCESVRGAAGAISMSGVGVSTTGPVIVVADPDQFRERILTDAFPPVMSYFEPQKRTLSGANFIRAQRDRWAAIASDASVVGLVGIRVRPGDRHIWDVLANTGARLVYCSGPRAAEEFEHWAAGARAAADDLVLQEYFDGGFEQLCTELALH